MQHLPHVLLRLLGFVLQLILPRLLKFDQLLGSRRVIWGLFHQIADLLAYHIEMLRQPFQIGNLAAQYFSLIIMSHRSLSFLQPLQPRKCSSSPFIIQDQNPKAEIVHRLYVRGSTFKPALPAYATPHPDTAAECGCMPVRPAVLHVQHPEWPPRSAEALIDPPPLSFYAIPAATPDHRVLQPAAAHAETNAPILCRIYGAIHHSDPYPHFRLALHICLSNFALLRVRENSDSQLLLKAPAPARPERAAWSENRLRPRQGRRRVDRQKRRRIMQ